MTTPRSIKNNPSTSLLFEISGRIKVSVFQDFYKLSVEQMVTRKLFDRDEFILKKYEFSLFFHITKNKRIAKFYAFGEFNHKMSCPIKGLFEIHVTVKNTNVPKLKIFCERNNLKAILACSGKGNDDCNSQVMISKWKSGVSCDVVSVANELSKEMAKVGLEVLRVKVEAMQSNEGVPNTKEESDKCIRGCYFEFHLKYPLKPTDNGMEGLEEAAKEVAENIQSQCDFGIGVSMNIFSAKNHPLLTLRVMDSWKEEAVRIKDELLDGLKEFGYKSNNGIQQEWAFYDTNQNLDDGWIQ
ncbi:putative ankyrin repeat-containing protein [Brazilian marseillevirus]|uniref:putative ankyrin repeat-containing protein n=1 Tax=Brazilian marseillevirus TaxID=1813599 RepID=UPI000785CEE1|nr:putative ankyrin repeat-containing protein [Brazilian marseillevirus]AMQ10892.1 putative ankyrin repeat-containing protein [Brazilian marseillevirus]